MLCLQRCSSKILFGCWGFLLPAIIKVEVHKMFTKNQHSTIDSANKACYNTIRTKEEEQKGPKRNPEELLLEAVTYRLQAKSLIKRRRNDLC